MLMPTRMSAADLEELRQVTRDFLTDRSGEQKVREAIESPAGWAEPLWQMMCTDLGLAGIAVPEALGGAGGGWPELAAVFEETGAALACVPLLSATIATQLLLAGGHAEAAGRIVPGIVEGNVVAVALTSPGGRWRGEDVPGVARHGSDGGWLVSGTYGHVLDGAAAAELLVLADGPGGPVLLAVATQQPGVRVLPRVSLDLTRPQAEVIFTDARAEPASLPGHASGLLAIARTVAGVCLAAEQSGGAQRVLDQVVAHAGTREQFGRSIGSFQAVKHSCAEMFLLAESARSASRAAAAAVDAANAIGPDGLDAEAERLAHVASAYCSRANREVAAAALQIHGGVGFTWEHPVHLQLKRARCSEALFGPSADHLDALADLLGI